MKTKHCCMCKKDIDIGQFKSNPRRKDGLQSQCIACQKEYRRLHYLKNKEKYIQKAADWRIKFRKWWKKYKATFACSVCKEKHPACIQFHHKDDNKEENVSVLATRDCSKKRLLKEIEKCVVLCANCHAKEHWQD